MVKTAIVTGASRGIGRATAQTLFDGGYNVVINYNHSKEKAVSLADELNSKCLEQRAIAVRADVANSGEVEEMFKTTIDTFGKLDLLVNNAGIAETKLITEVSDDDWRRMMSVHMDGAFYCSRAAARLMVSQHSGCIVNISSMWGQTGAACEVPYCAAKAGMIGLTKALAKELGPSNIRVNCICPGVVLTDMNASHTEETLEMLKDETPLCILGTPQDIADSVLFLSSDKASFITGQILGVNGGIVI